MSADATIPAHRPHLAAGLVLALTLGGTAVADLTWFDLPLSEDRPHVSFAEVVAWSDACLAVKPEEWTAVERVYAEYVKGWNGDGRDEDKLWDGLNNALGADRANCIGAFRASAEAVLRARDTSTRHVTVRRELLALAAMRGPSAADAQRVVRQLGARIADSVAERTPGMFDEVPPAREVLDVRDAIVPLRGNIAAIAGEERADAILANLVQAFELSGTTALSSEFRSIVRNATRLPPEQRERLAAAYNKADAKLRGRSAYEQPKETRTAVDEELYREAEAILGTEHAELLRSLAGGYVDVRTYPEFTGPKPNTPIPDVMNSGADALLGRFVDEEGFAGVEAVMGRPFWRPLSGHSMKPVIRPEPGSMTPAFLADVAGAKGDDELAIVEAIHGDHTRRYAVAEHSYNTIMSKEGRLAAITEMSLAEDEKTLAELQAAFGADRVGTKTLALARLARLERTLPFFKLATRFDTMSRIPWPSGSPASIALGQDMPDVAPLPASRRAALRGILEESADALVAGKLAAWRELVAANRAFDAVEEQFAGQNRVARERLVAIQAARLAGLAACASAARRGYIEAITLVDRLAGEDQAFHAQYIALALLEQDLGRTDAGRRLRAELARIGSAEDRDRALTALVPLVPGAVEILRTASEAALAAGNMDDGDLSRIRAGTAVLTAHKEARRRLDRAMRAQVAIAWRTLRDAGNASAKDAFAP